MSTDGSTRHILPQPLSSGPFWSNDAVPDASSDDNSLKVDDTWLLDNKLIGDYDFPGSNDYDAAFYGHPDSSSAHQVDFGYGHVPNALGLDPITASSRQLSDGLPIPSGHISPSHHARTQQLPQIVTNDLPMPHVFPRSPVMHSPTDYTSGPYSALSPSPASSAHNTMPVTPASMHSGGLAPYINTGLLSPSSPYLYQYSPGPKSVYTPSLSGPASPSMLSYSSHSPTDEVTPPAHGPRQTHPTVLDIAASFPQVYQSMIPQRTYRPHTQSDRRRYVEEVELEAPIMFYMSHPDRLGIPCRDALNCRFAQLAGRDDQMFINRGPSVSIRLMWPGYAPWSRQIPTRDFRSPPGPITRSKLAKNVAKTVQRFIEEMRVKPMEEEADARWRIGANRITVEDLELVGLQHVSMGSWQAHLRLRSRS
ncbi:hypothetical protein NM688_g8286 [Phlebia brevispora]|uniref:Uncharacterized protein n=1 Tax=Phlebia brevispora TaxID=194682 RepID=A0ACC1RUE7_9APHY|nr:hypothetical protein NM688_g8286 [Phlebia brevispora]